MAQWEYLTRTLTAAGVGGGTVLRDRLCDLGDQGWELVSALPVGDGVTANFHTYVFKRPRADWAGATAGPSAGADEPMQVIGAARSGRAA